MTRNRMIRISICFAIMVVELIAILSFFNVKTAPEKSVIVTDKYTAVDIDGKDGSYFSIWSEAEIHTNESGEIEWIYIPVDVLLAFDIPDRFGDRVYCLSADDFIEICNLLNAIKTENNSTAIDSIIKILEDEYYQYTPT